MKITLDTNVLLSATFWRGDSFHIIKKVERKEIELVLSDAILEEFRRVLQYEEIQDKIKQKHLEVLNAFDTIAELSTNVTPKRTINLIHEDQSDNKILECAIEGQVNYIITNDIIF